MKKNTQFINSIDIQKEYLSIVKYSPQDNAVVLMAIQPMATGGVDTIWSRTSTALHELKTKYKFTSPEIICSIPAEFAFVKRLVVDKTIAKSPEMLEWEFSQHLLGSMEEYAVDFQYDGIYQSQQCGEYLAVAYRKENLDHLLSALKILKLKPQVVDLDMFAIVNVFEANYKDRISEPVILVHSEGGKTKILLTQDGCFIDTHIFESENEQSDSVMYAERFAEELNSFVKYNSTRLTQSASLFFTGSLFSDQEFFNAVVSKTGYGELLNPFREIGCRVGTASDQMTYAPQLAVAVGLALRGYE